MRIQREGAQLQPRGMRSAGPGDDQARFLADLRALRDGAAIGYDELAARAHYPSDILKEAENGPYLPTLPILAAYVRACEGDVLEWEERWRRVANEAAGDPGLPVRSAGASPAAVAGARAGVGVVPPDAYDPERIKAALRGSGSRPSGPTATPGIAAAAARDTGSDSTAWSFADARSTGWDTAEAPAGWDAKALETADPPAGWDTIDAGPGLNDAEDAAAGWTAATDGAAAAWTAATDGAAAGWTANPGWDMAVDQALANGNHETQQRNGSFDAVDQESQFAGSWPHDSELVADQQGGESAWPGLQQTELEPWSPGTQASPPEAASGELGWAEVPAIPEVLGHAQVRAEPQVGSVPLQAAAPQAKERPADRLYSLRLLVIIVVAALIGSGLVLLFK